MKSREELEELLEWMKESLWKILIDELFKEGGEDGYK